MKFWKIIACYFVGHEYTCRAAEGEDPTQAEIDAGSAGFFVYATMYCKRCDKVFDPRR